MLVAHFSHCGIMPCVVEKSATVGKRGKRRIVGFRIVRLFSSVVENRENLFMRCDGLARRFSAVLRTARMFCKSHSSACYVSAALDLHIRKVSMFFTSMRKKGVAEYAEQIQQNKNC